MQIYFAIRILIAFVFNVGHENKPGSSYSSLQKKQTVILEKNIFKKALAPVRSKQGVEENSEFTTGALGFVCLFVGLTKFYREY